ncbi:MAG: hypothetical protein KF678_08055 [Phycisphaeraceae bacterium]|nr:hypothetical protein [Phycisphaeraceae bacterium]
MPKAVTRWSIYFLALLLAGPAAGSLMHLARTADGGQGTALVNTSPLLGLLAAAGALAIAAVIGLLSVRIIGFAHALTAAGYILAWAAWKSGDVSDLIRTAGSGAPLTRLSVEGLLLGIPTCAIVWFMHRLSIAAPTKLRLTPNTLVCILTATAAGGVAAWLIAATPLKGQAVFAAIAGGVFAAAASRLVDFSAPIPTMFIPIVLLSIIGPLTGLFMSGASGVVPSLYKGSLFPLAHITPLDWIAGGLLGIPMGVSWAGSMIEKRHPEAAPSAQGAGGSPANARK